MNNKKALTTILISLLLLVLITIYITFKGTITTTILNVNNKSLDSNSYEQIKLITTDCSKVSSKSECLEVEDLVGLNSSALFLSGHPVKSIYITLTDANPGTTYGGTWVAYGQGRVLVGAGHGVDANNTAMDFSSATNSIGGKYNTNLIEANLPAHSHTIIPSGSVSSSFSGASTSTSTNGNHAHNYTASGSVSSSFSGNSGTTSWNSGHSHSYGTNAYFTVYWGVGNGFSGIYGNNSGWGDYWPADWYYPGTSYSGEHYHSFTPSGSVSSSFSGGWSTTSGSGSHTHTFTASGSVSSSFSGTTVTTSSTGNGSSFNIQNPYIVVYMWQRTA